MGSGPMRWRILQHKQASEHLKYIETSDSISVEYTMRLCYHEIN